MNTLQIQYLLSIEHVRIVVLREVLKGSCPSREEEAEEEEEEEEVEAEEEEDSQRQIATGNDEALRTRGVCHGLKKI